MHYNYAEDNPKFNAELAIEYLFSILMHDGNIGIDWFGSTGMQADPSIYCLQSQQSPYLQLWRGILLLCLNPAWTI